MVDGDGGGFTPNRQEREAQGSPRDRADSVQQPARDIDYCWSEAHTTYGRLGIKVWICKGEIFGKVDLAPTQDSKKKGGPGKFKGKKRR